MYWKLKGGPGAAPFAAKFTDDTKHEEEAVNVLEGRAALQRDLTGWKSWADRGLKRSSKGTFQVLPQDRQKPPCKGTG